MLLNDAGKPDAPADNDLAESEATKSAVPKSDATVCFVRGTHIKTIAGERPVEALSVNDLILTMDAGYQPIRWIGSRTLDGNDLAAKPGLRPIRICAGALAPGLPTGDLIVSPNHRILSRSKIARNMFGFPEVLVAAKDLVFLGGVAIADDLDVVEYWHFMFDRHQVVYAEGSAAESLFASGEALAAIPPEALRELFEIMPELARMDARVEKRLARPELTGQPARHLALRHARQNRAFFAEL
ncbi:MAG: Hint domain-containing protein [Rhodobacterales bacterium]